MRIKVVKEEKEIPKRKGEDLFSPIKKRPVKNAADLISSLNQKPTQKNSKDPVFVCLGTVMNPWVLSDLSRAKKDEAARIESAAKQFGSSICSLIRGNDPHSKKILFLECEEANTENLAVLIRNIITKKRRG